MRQRQRVIECLGLGVRRRVGDYGQPEPRIVQQAFDRGDRLRTAALDDKPDLELFRGVVPALCIKRTKGALSDRASRARVGRRRELQLRR